MPMNADIYMQPYIKYLYKNWQETIKMVMTEKIKEILNKIFLIGYWLLTDTAVKAICGHFAHCIYNLALVLKVT